MVCLLSSQADKKGLGRQPFLHSEIRIVKIPGAQFLFAQKYKINAEA